MTETTESPAPLAPAIRRFVMHWGEMGQVWGVNRSVAQIHALLYVSSEPMTAEAIAEHLKLARSNVSTSLRELMGWGLVRRASVFGDRRDYFEAETDLFEMVRRIAAGRKAREIDPTVSFLRSCADSARRDPRVSRPQQRRVEAMLEFSETFDRSLDELLDLPSPILLKLMKMGGAVARLVSGRTPSRRKRSQN